MIPWFDSIRVQNFTFLCYVCRILEEASCYNELNCGNKHKDGIIGPRVMTLLKIYTFTRNSILTLKRN